MVHYHRTGRGLRDFFHPQVGALKTLFPGTEAFLEWLANRPLLDLGCGEGKLVLELSMIYPLVHGVDLHLPKPIKNYVNRFTEGDAFSLPFRNSSFGVIFASWSVFHYEQASHFPDLFLEAARVLKPQGVLVIPTVEREKRVVEIIAHARELNFSVIYHEPSRTLLCTRE